MIYELPTRSPRRYRGKYPNRISSWGTGRSADQQALAEFLSISRAVHLELNDGTRYIADIKSLRPDSLKLGVDLDLVIHPDIMFVESAWVKMHQEYYDAMLAVVIAVREKMK